MFRAMVILGLALWCGGAEAAETTVAHARVDAVKGKILNLAASRGWHMTKESASQVQIERDDANKPQTWRLSFTMIQNGKDVRVVMDTFRIWHSTYGDDELIGPITNVDLLDPIKAEMLSPLGARS